MTEGPGVSPPRRDHAWLTPSWASSATIASVLVTAVIAGLVWHSRQLGGLDAWVEGELGAQSDS
jgi:hypothetical protein